MEGGTSFDPTQYNPNERPPPSLIAREIILRAVSAGFEACRIAMVSELISIMADFLTPLGTFIACDVPRVAPRSHEWI